MIIKAQQDVYAAIYAEGQNQPATIRLWEDGGHAWLQVPLRLLKDLNIVKEVTGYSYMDSKFAYLEEDCDLTTFMNAIGLSYSDKMSEEKEKLRNLFWSVCPREYHDYSPIRSKSHYEQPK